MVTEVSKVYVGLIVRCRVTVLSQPYAFPPTKVCVAVSVETVYVLSYQVKLTHSTAVVSPNEG